MDTMPFRMTRRDVHQRWSRRPHRERCDRLSGGHDVLRLPALAEGATWVVYGDHADASAAYVLPDAPRLRRAPDGRALLSLVKVRDVSAGTGGLLDLQTDLRVGPAEQSAALDAFRDATGTTARPADPMWLSGTATLTVPGTTVTAADARPALSGVAPASFVCGVSGQDATLLAAGLGSGSGLLQVGYQLRALTILPPCRVHVFLRAGPLAAAWAGLPAEARHEGLAACGAAGVDVDDDAGSLDQGLREQLVAWAWDWLDAVIAARTPVTGGPPEGPDLDQVLVGTNGLPWPFAPAGTLPGLGPGETDWLSETDLSTPVFPVLRISTRANALFKADRLAAVTAHLTYGDQRHDAVLTAPDSVDELAVVAVPALGLSYDVAPVVSFTASSRTVAMPPFRSSARDLLITVVDLGWLRVLFTSWQVDWAMVSTVGVDIRYVDEAEGVPLVQDALVLDSSSPSGAYERAVYTARNRPYEVRRRWSLADGRVVVQDWAPSTARTFDVGAPFASVLWVRFRAPGLAGDVATLTVDVTRDLVAATPRVTTFQLDPLHTEALWTEGLVPGAPATFHYRVTTSLQDGRSSQAPWQEGAGGGVIAVGPQVGAHLELNVVADLVDFSVVQLVTVSLRHEGPPLCEDDLAFSPPAPRARLWTVPLGPGEEPSYTWSATYYAAGHPARTTPSRTSSEVTLVLPWP